MQTMPKFNIILADETGNQLELNYHLHPTRSAHLWFEALKNSVKESQIKESRFYNFPGQNKGSLEGLIDTFQKVLTELRTFCELPELNTSSEQALHESLNLLHRNFAHNHLVIKLIPHEQLALWDNFNSLIHQIESALVARRTKSSVSLCRIEFTWINPFKFAIPEDCYKEFSLIKSFGSLQIAYCQIGRNLTELFSAKDTDLPTEHIQPARFFSANSGLWFGPNLTDEYAKEYHLQIEAWFKKNEIKFNEAGVFWERDDKSLGLVTVAQMTRSFANTQEMQDFQNELARYSHVAHVQILD